MKLLQKVRHPVFETQCKHHADRFTSIQSPIIGLKSFVQQCPRNIVTQVEVVRCHHPRFAAVALEGSTYSQSSAA